MYTQNKEVVSEGWKLAQAVLVYMDGQVYNEIDEWVQGLEETQSSHAFLILCLFSQLKLLDSTLLYYPSNNISKCPLQTSLQDLYDDSPTLPDIQTEEGTFKVHQNRKPSTMDAGYPLYLD
jgi:hypothetical protein